MQHGVAWSSDRILILQMVSVESEMTHLWKALKLAEAPEEKRIVL
jgi:hypothetical protein